MIHIESYQMIVLVPRIGQSYEEAKKEVEEFFDDEGTKDHYGIPPAYSVDVEHDDEEEEEFRFLVSFSDNY